MNDVSIDNQIMCQFAVISRESLSQFKQGERANSGYRTYSEQNHTINVEEND